MADTNLTAPPPSPYYQDEWVTLYHGDALHVLPSLTGVATTVTSPPYNTLTFGKPSGMYAKSAWLAKVAAHGYSDDMTEPEYAEWQRHVAAAVHASTRPGGSFFYNHKCRWRGGELSHPIDLVRSFDGWKLRQEVIWDRHLSMTFNARMFATSEERVYWMFKDDAPYIWNQEAASFLSVWRLNPQTGTDGHPCPFPEAIPQRAIIATTNPGDIVLDPFAGSGTTLRAAADLGRKAIGIEIDERYCEVIASRMAQGALDLYGGAR